MRIRSLHVAGFGKFADFRRGPFERPATIFYGANEAGKSTLLAFIRRVLLGFPDGRSRRNPYPPLGGGRHGGNITLVSDAGDAVTVERYQGSGGGPVTLTSVSGEPIAAAALPKLLGGHSRHIFESIFAFTLDELHDEALLKDESVNSQLYSAGMGAARLPHARRTLDERKRRLFLKGGSKHALHIAANSLDAVAAKLRDVRDNAATYGRLSARLRDVESELARLNDDRKAQRGRLDRANQRGSAWDDWIEFNSASAELAELPALKDFPADGARRLDALEEALKTTQKERDDARDETRQAKALAEAAIEHESLLVREDVIRDLERRRTAFDNAVADLPKRQADLAQCDGRLAATLKDLGSDWDADRLDAFDLSLAVREDIAGHQESLREGDANVRRRESNLEQAQAALTEANEAVAEAEQYLNSAEQPAFDEQEINPRRTLLREARATLAEENATRQRISDLQLQLNAVAGGPTPTGANRGGWLPAVIGVAGIAAAGAGMVYGVELMLVGVALLGYAAYRFALGKVAADPSASAQANAIGGLLRQAKTDAVKLESLLLEVASTLGVEAIDDTALRAAETALDEAQARVQEMKRRAADLEREQASAQRRDINLQRAKEAVVAACAERDRARNDWADWLRARGLRETLLPETVGELRSDVDLGLNQLGEQRDLQGRVKAIQTSIDQYVALAEALVSDFGVALNRNDYGSVAAAADRLVDLHRDVASQAEKRRGAAGNLKQAEARLERREKDREAAERAIAALLKAGGAEDAEVFRLRADQQEKRGALDDQRRSALGRLQRLSGAGEPLESLMAELKGTDIQDIRGRVEELQEQSDATAGKIEELSTERGEIRSELDRLIGEEESSRLRLERNRLLEQMDGHARDWAVLAVAENLLAEAQAKFERERQPEVLSSAGDYFRGMTRGRYTNVFSPLGESELRVTDGDGQSLRPDQLSRGTREQLFLSLRFGLIRELGQHSERLPVIVDEALVNFDPDRGLKAAHAFLELAEQNQVLVFTCHPQIVDWFATAADDRGSAPPEMVSFG